MFGCLFNENASLQFCNFFKKRLQHWFFPVNIAKFLRIHVLKNICERLSKRFPTWISNITSNIWSGHFLKKKSKQKNIFKLSEKKNLENTCLFMILLIILFLSISQMHLRQRLPYIIKDDSIEGLQNSLTNERLTLDQWKNVYLFRTYLFI